MQMNAPRVLVPLRSLRIDVEHVVLGVGVGDADELGEQVTGAPFDRLVARPASSPGVVAVAIGVQLRRPTNTSPSCSSAQSTVGIDR